MTTDLNNLNFDQLVPRKSKYLTKDDVGKDGMALTVNGVRMEAIETDDGVEKKVVLLFVENVKPMVLNVTNAQLLAVSTGVSTAAEAKGKKVIVFHDPTVSFGGKITGGLRIRPVRKNEKPTEPELDDGDLLESAIP